MPHRAISLALVSALVACGGGGGGAGSDGGGTDGPAALPTVFGGSARPATLHVPADYDASKAYPLVMILHGYSATGLLQEAYFGLRAEVDAGSALEIAPDGLVDSHGEQYWNADPGCCDFDGTNPDDSGYLGDMLKDIIAAYHVDATRVFVVGHSNGGYMAYRLACDHADLITGLGVLAGIVPSAPTECPPSQPVNVLHMHGTADAEVPYGEGSGSGLDSAYGSNYPGAVGSVTKWSGYDGCGSDLVPGATMDLDTSVAGAETQISDFTCPTGKAVELWTLNGSSHIPSMNATFEPTLWGWLMSHPRDIQ